MFLLILALFTGIVPVFSWDFEKRARSYIPVSSSLLLKETTSEKDVSCDLKELNQAFGSFKDAFDRGYFTAALAFSVQDPSWGDRYRTGCKGYLVEFAKTQGLQGQVGFLMRHHERLGLNTNAVKKAYQEAFHLYLKYSGNFNDVMDIWNNPLFDRRAVDLDILLLAAQNNKDRMTKFFKYCIDGRMPSSDAVEKAFHDAVRRDDKELVELWIEKCPFALSPAVLDRALDVIPSNSRNSFLYLHPIHQIIHLALGRDKFGFKTYIYYIPPIPSITPFVIPPMPSFYRKDDPAQ